MKQAIVWVTALVVFATGAMAAEGQALSGKALRMAVSGKTVYLKTEWGVELPIAYEANGTMTGRLRGLVAALPVGAPRADQGKWWIANGELCQKWQKWLDGQAYCYKLTPRGNMVHWRRNDGRGGTARFAG